MNLSPTTILFIVVAAVVFFGPDKLPELARKAARVLYFMRNVANQAQDTVRSEFGPEFADFDIRNPRKFVKDKIMGEYSDIAQELDSVRGTLSGAATDMRSAAGVLTTGAAAVSTRPMETTVIEVDHVDGEPVVEQLDVELKPAPRPEPEPIDAEVVDDESAASTPDWRDEHYARYQEQAQAATLATTVGAPYDVDAT